MLRTYLQALRPLAHANLLPPLVFGQALAYAQGYGFDPLMAVAVHAFGLLDHAYIVLANDFADRSADQLNDAPTLVSGGSRCLQEGKVSASWQAKAAGGAALLLFLFSTAVALLLARPWLIALALVALLLLQAYSFAPLKLSYRGFGEVAQGLGVGLVLPAVGFYLQSGHLDTLPYARLAPLVLLAFVSNILTALPDEVADRHSRKQTWPVRRGGPRARTDALVLIGVALLLITQLTPGVSPPLLAPILLIPSAALVVAYRSHRRGTQEHSQASDPPAANWSPMLFVLLGLFAIASVQLSWAAALFLSSP